MKSRIKRWIRRAFIRIGMAIVKHELKATQQEMDAQAAEVTSLAAAKDEISTLITAAVRKRPESEEVINRLKRRRAEVTEEHLVAVDFLGRLLYRRDKLVQDREHFIRQLEETA